MLWDFKCRMLDGAAALELRRGLCSDIFWLYRADIFIFIWYAAGFMERGLSSGRRGTWVYGCCVMFSVVGCFWEHFLSKEKTALKVLKLS